MLLVIIIGGRGRGYSYTDLHIVGLCPFGDGLDLSKVVLLIVGGAHLRNSNTCRGLRSHRSDVGGWRLPQYLRDSFSQQRIHEICIVCGRGRKVDFILFNSLLIRCCYCCWGVNVCVVVRLLYNVWRSFCYTVRVSVPAQQNVENGRQNFHRILPRSMRTIVCFSLIVLPALFFCTEIHQLVRKFSFERSLPLSSHTITFRQRSTKKTKGLGVSLSSIVFTSL